MDIFPKFIASLLVIILAAYIGMSMVMCGISVVSARTFYTSTADFIESVDTVHESAVIDECKMLAEKNGYTLVVDKKEVSGAQYYYGVTLKYRFPVPFLDEIIDAKVEGNVYPKAHFNIPAA